MCKKILTAKNNKNNIIIKEKNINCQVRLFRQLIDIMNMEMLYKYIWQTIK